MAALTREQIIGMQMTLPKREVEIDGFGSVYVRAVTSGEMDEYLKMSRKHKGKNGALTFVLSVCDEDGRNLFTYDDLPLIDKYPFFVLNAVSTAANELNRIVVDEEDEDEEE